MFIKSLNCFILKRNGFKYFTKIRSFCTNYLAELRNIIPEDIKYDPNKTAMMILTHGSEEMSCAIITDILGRAGIRMTVAGLGGYEPLRCSNRVVIKPTATLEETVLSGLPFDCIYVPGAYKGILAMCESNLVGQLLKMQDNHRRFIACTNFACIVLAHFGVGQGKKITAHTAAEQFYGKHFIFIKNAPLVVDGHIISIRSPTNMVRMALVLVELISGINTATTVANIMNYKYTPLAHKPEVAATQHKEIPSRDDVEHWQAEFDANLAKGIKNIEYFTKFMRPRAIKQLTDRSPELEFETLDDNETEEQTPTGAGKNADNMSKSNEMISHHIQQMQTEKIDKQKGLDTKRETDINDDQQERKEKNKSSYDNTTLENMRTESGHKKSDTSETKQTKKRDHKKINRDSKNDSDSEGKSTTNVSSDENGTKHKKHILTEDERINKEKNTMDDLKVDGQAHLPETRSEKTDDSIDLHRRREIENEKRRKHLQSATAPSVKRSEEDKEAMIEKDTSPGLNKERAVEEIAKNLKTEDDRLDYDREIDKLARSRRKAQEDRAMQEELEQDKEDAEREQLNNMKKTVLLEILNKPKGPELKPKTLKDEKKSTPDEEEVKRESINRPVLEPREEEKLKLDNDIAPVQQEAEKKPKEKLTTPDEATGQKEPEKQIKQKDAVVKSKYAEDVIEETVIQPETKDQQYDMVRKRERGLAITRQREKSAKAKAKEDEEKKLKELNKVLEEEIDYKDIIGDAHHYKPPKKSVSAVKLDKDSSGLKNKPIDKDDNKILKQEDKKKKEEDYIKGVDLEEEYKNYDKIHDEEIEQAVKNQTIPREATEETKQKKVKKSTKEHPLGKINEEEIHEIQKEINREEANKGEESDDWHDQVIKEQENLAKSGVTKKPEEIQAKESFAKVSEQIDEEINKIYNKSQKRVSGATNPVYEDDIKMEEQEEIKTQKESSTPDARLIEEKNEVSETTTKPNKKTDIKKTTVKKPKKKTARSRNEKWAKVRKIGELLRKTDIKSQREALRNISKAEETDLTPEMIKAIEDQLRAKKKRDIIEEKKSKKLKDENSDENL